MTADQARKDGFELGTDGPSSILVGLDGAEVGSEESVTSLHAAAYASGLARRQGARLIAVWVRPQLALADTFADTAAVISGGRAATEADVRHAVEAAAAYFGIPDTDFVVREGDPFHELTKLAEEAQVDAIVVGASAHRLGSLAVRLVRDGRWPVTVVP